MKDSILRRACVFGIVMLLSLTIITCGFNAAENQPNIVGYTDDGRPIMELTINAGVSRALTDVLARASVDFYEVVFFDGTNYHRATWHRGQAGRLRVPAGATQYDVATNAVLFAGIYDSKTLLAVGRLSHINGAAVSGATAVIGADTTAVTFTLTSLVTNVSATGATSTFQITGPTGLPGGASAWATAGLGTLPTTTDSFGQTIPIFRIPSRNEYAGYGNTPTVSDGPVQAAFGIDTAAANINAFLPGIIVTDLNVVRTHLHDTNRPDGFVNVTGVINTTAGSLGANPVQSAAPSALLTPINLLLTVSTTGNQNGLCRIYLDIPVVAISTTASGTTWFIRGGINNHQLDGGAAVNSLGGAILLGIGNYSPYITVTTTP